MWVRMSPVGEDRGGGWLKSFFDAVRFLTVLRIGNSAGAPSPRTMVYFPLVGLLIGCILAGAGRLSPFNPTATAIFLVVALALLTGGLHLDGLADSADALFSGRDRAEMLDILRDPHVGSWGVLGLVCVILVKVALVSSLEHRTAGLVVMCVSSRWAMVWMMSLFPYARAEGKAKIFFDGITRRIFWAATVPTLISVAIFGGIRGLLVFGISAAAALPAGRWMNRRLGGMTGDTVGAVNEWTEIAALAAASLIEQIEPHILSRFLS